MSQMHVRLIIGLVALVSVSVCGIISGLVGFQIVDKVNELLPNEQRFASLGWYLISTKGSLPSTGDCIRMATF